MVNTFWFCFNVWKRSNQLLRIPFKYTGQIAIEWWSDYLIEGRFKFVYSLTLDLYILDSLIWPLRICILPATFSVVWAAVSGMKKECPNDCSDMGTCNKKTGVCECMAECYGADCSIICETNCSNQAKLYIPSKINS